MPSDDGWGFDNPEEKRRLHERQKATGLDRMALAGLVWLEWEIFEERIRIRSSRMHAETGSFMYDGDKARHRSKFRALLLRKYGMGDPPDNFQPREMTDDDRLRMVKIPAERHESRNAPKLKSPKRVQGENGWEATLKRMEAESRAYEVMSGRSDPGRRFVELTRRAAAGENVDDFLSEAVLGQ